MKKILLILLFFCLTFSLTSCNENNFIEGSDSQTNSEQLESNPNETESDNILVAFFSLAGEQYEVGNIEKGNTEIVAEIINDKVGGDFFKIESVKQYPTSYEELLEEAGKEEETPPEIANTLENIDQYDTIFLGYPIWNGDNLLSLKSF